MIDLAGTRSSANCYWQVEGYVRRRGEFSPDGKQAVGDAKYRFGGRNAVVS